jgi:hypothetical protein
MPTTEPSINGPKDSFNESILTNLGLIKRRIKSDKLVNEDMFIGRKTLTKVSVLYLDDIADKSIVSEITNKLSDIDTIYIIKNDTLNNHEKDYEISNKKVNIQRIFVDNEEDSGSANSKVSEEILYNKIKPNKFIFEDEIEIENRRVR